MVESGPREGPIYTHGVEPYKLLSWVLLQQWFAYSFITMNSEKTANTFFQLEGSPGRETVFQVHAGMHGLTGRRRVMEHEQGLEAAVRTILLLMNVCSCSSGNYKGCIGN